MFSAVPCSLVARQSRHHSLFFFFLRIRPPPKSPLFPYPTLFRSKRGYDVHAVSRLAHRPPLFARVAWHERALLTPGAPASLLRTLRPEFLLHFAWYAVPSEVK